MKRFFILTLCILTLTACNKSNNVANGDVVVCNFDGLEWDQYIDSQQYGGDMLYSGSPYRWCDPASGISGGFTDAYGDSKFWGGCSAISNYTSTDYLNNGTFEQQLTAMCDSAYSGENFMLLHGCNSEYGDARGAISFRGGARQILSAEICITTYMYFVATTDNHLTAPLDENGWIMVEAEGFITDDYGEDISNGKVCQLYLFRGREAQFSGWKHWDLSDLGRVNKVKFDFKASDNPKGTLYPSYLAVDDIRVLN